MVRLLCPLSKEELNAELGRRCIYLPLVYFLGVTLSAPCRGTLHLPIFEDLWDSLGGGEGSARSKAENPPWSLMQDRYERAHSYSLSPVSSQL